MTEEISTAIPPEETERFADPAATKRVELGPCRCPGRPHPGGDSAVVRASIGDGEARSVRLAGWQSTGGQYNDFEFANDTAIARFVLTWTLLRRCPAEEVGGRTLPAGIRAARVDRASASQLDETTRTALLVALEESYEAAGGPLPNASGAPSRASRAASASRTRTTRPKP